MKYQMMFSGKNKKNTINLSSAENFTQHVIGLDKGGKYFSYFSMETYIVGTH